ncbi:MAG: DUF4190 domain-containing protein [Eubacterium sp.]|nr:DUF4190 domain-containing protein [Eubacterium sp.]
MVLGIISLVVFCLGFNIILAILAIIFGAIALRKSDKRGMAIAGIVTGIISIVLFVLVCLVVGASFMTMMNDGNLDDFNELYEYYNNGGDLNEVPNTNDMTDGLEGGTVNYEFDSNGATYTVYFD